MMARLPLGARVTPATRVCMALAAATLAAAAGCVATGGVSYTLADGEIREPLTAGNPDAERGRKVLVSREANCILCHAVPETGERFFGNLAPPLSGIGRRLTAAQMRDYPTGRLVRACGIVTARQQPQTAKGVVFVTLEDETGSVNVIVWRSTKEQFRDVVYRARLMAVYGVWQRDDESGGDVRHVVAKRLEDLTPLLGDLATTSRDFH